MVAWVFASCQAVVTTRPFLARLQVDAALTAYGRIFPASAPPPVFDEVLAEWRGRLGTAVGTGQKTLVAVDNGRIVGMLVAGPDPARPDRGHVARFYVSPDRWGQGIGHRLYLGAVGLASTGRLPGSDAVGSGAQRSSPRCGTNGWAGRATGEQKSVYEPAGVVDLQYVIGLAAPVGGAGDEIAHRPLPEGSGPASMTGVRSAGTVGEVLAARRANPICRPHVGARVVSCCA